MGNRALVVFHDEHEYSPAVYLHWHGSKVPDLLRETWQYMEGRRGDLDYTAARFVGICHNAIEGNLSLGLQSHRECRNSDSHKDRQHRLASWEPYSPGDAGVFLVNVKTGHVERTEDPNSECEAPREFSCAKAAP
jgi:hypothetical protein